MRYKKILILFILVMVLITSSSCKSSQKHYDIESYKLDLDITGKESFRILQLTDIHVGNKDDRKRQYDYLTTIIESSNCDMIVVTGDLFTFGTRKVAKELFDFLDSFNVPWTVTFGNHDEQCYFSIDWLTNKLNTYGSNCFFIDHQDDDVYGNANFFINLNKNGEIFEQLIVLDSNRYHFGDYFGYDYLKDGQIDWYSNVIDYNTEKTGHIVDSLVFMHIPVPEFEDAWNGIESGNPDCEFIMGEKNEDVSCPETNSGFFDRVLEKESTKGIFVGHDHVSNFIVKYKGVYFGYGITSTDRIYYKDGLLGGRVITINSDHSLTFEDILKEY